MLCFVVICLCVIALRFVFVFVIVMYPFVVVEVRMFESLMLVLMVRFFVCFVVIVAVLHSDYRASVFCVAPCFTKHENTPQPNNKCLPLPLRHADDHHPCMS